MFRLFIQDIEEIIDLHSTVLTAIHNLDRDDRDTAVRFIQRTLRRVFDTQGFGTWPQLSSLYRRWKEQAAPGKPILRLEDDYYQAATRKGHPGNYLEEVKISEGKSDSQGKVTGDFYSVAYRLNEDWFESTSSDLVDKGFFYPKLHEQEGGVDIYAPHVKGGSYHLPERPVFRLAEDDAALRADVLKLYRIQVAKKLSNIHKGGKSLKGRKGITQAERNVLIGRPGGIRGKGEDTLPF